MGTQKFLEINSQFRNRDQWENPFCFSIPINSSQKLTHCIDPICFSLPTQKFRCLPLEIKVSQNLTLVDGWNFFPGNFSQTPNIYKGTFVNGYKVLNSFSTQTVLAIEVKVDKPIPPPLVIQTRTNLDHGIMHLPGMVHTDNFYKNWVLRNETLESYTLILNYLDSMVLFKPQKGWAHTHQYTLRRKYESPIYRIVSTLENGLLAINSPIKPPASNQLLYIKSTGAIATILETGTNPMHLKVYPILPRLIDEPCEIFSNFFDNFQPLVIPSSTTIQTIEILNIFLPNIRLTNGNFISNYHTLYLKINLGESKLTSHYSNAPGFSKANFLICFHKLNKNFIEYKPPIRSTIDCSGISLSEFFICVYDLYGNPLEPHLPDTVSPILPNPDLQMKIFSIIK